HYSKIFKRLMGTTCSLSWREAGERERIWTVNPMHPIAAGIEPCIVLDREEMYGEPFGIPEPEQTVFLSWFKGGEVFRSGVCYERGGGRIFYFRPGHETYPTYHDERIQRVICNAVHWARPRADKWIDQCPNVVTMPEGSA
ncbi:MAG: trehalose utilization protein ThuA, partial [Planctomycetota bacterium]